MADSLFDTADRALDTIAAGLDGLHRDAEGVGETLERLGEQARPRGVPPTPQQDAACRHLTAGLASAQAVDRALAEALAALAPLLHWQRIPEHVPHPPDPFMDDYAFAKIFGPQGVYPGEDFMMGLFIIGPQQFYPTHLHQAPELYWLFSSPTEWRFGEDAPWETKPPGALHWNRPYHSHAMRTGDVPFFALWAWTRDIDGDYHIVGAEGAVPLNRQG